MNYVRVHFFAYYDNMFRSLYHIVVEHHFIGIYSLRKTENSLHNSLPYKIQIYDIFYLVQYSMPLMTDYVKNAVEKYIQELWIQ